MVSGQRRGRARRDKRRWERLEGGEEKRRARATATATSKKEGMARDVAGRQVERTQARQGRVDAISIVEEDSGRLVGKAKGKRPKAKGILVFR